MPRGVAGELASATYISRSATFKRVSFSNLTYKVMTCQSLTIATAGLSLIWRRYLSSLFRRGGNHQDKALLGGRELRNVVIRMRPTDVLLHGAIAFLL